MLFSIKLRHKTKFKIDFNDIIFCEYFALYIINSEDFVIDWFINFDIVCFWNVIRFICDTKSFLKIRQNIFKLSHRRYKYKIYATMHSIGWKIFSLSFYFNYYFGFLYMSPSHVVASERRLSAHIVSIFSFSFFFRKCIYIYQWGGGGMYFGPWKLQPLRDGDALLTLNWWTKATTIGLRCPELFLERHPGGRCISRRWCVSCVFVYNYSVARFLLSSTICLGGFLKYAEYSMILDTIKIINLKMRK